MRYERGNRKIYLNQERIPKNNATPIEENCEIDVAESCYHNINNKYKNNYISDKIDKTKNRIKRKESLPYWFEHPESIKKVEATKEEQEEMERLLNEIVEEDWYMTKLMKGYYYWLNNNKGEFIMTEVKYNVTYKFKTDVVKTIEEKKEIFNKKLLNIILQTENKDLLEA